MRKINSRDELTQEYIRSILDYNPETGIFTWKTNKSYSIECRMDAGYISKKNNVIMISIDKIKFCAGELIFLYVYNIKVFGNQDRYNGILNDNRLDNIKLSCSGYTFNCNRGCWQVYFRVSGKNTFFGYYEYEKDAIIKAINVKFNLGLISDELKDALIDQENGNIKNFLKERKLKFENYVENNSSNDDKNEFYKINSRDELTQEYIRSILDYNPETGELFWKIKSSLSVNVGDIAGCARGNIIAVKIYGVYYACGEIIFLWMTGERVKGNQDRYNGILNDNRWENIRHKINGIYSIKRGVYQCVIMHNGNKIIVGHYNDKITAQFKLIKHQLKIGIICKNKYDVLLSEISKEEFLIKKMKKIKEKEKENINFAYEKTRFEKWYLGYFNNRAGYYNSAVGYIDPIQDYLFTQWIEIVKKSKSNNNIKNHQVHEHAKNY